jgi:hypothetical protein
LGGALASLAAMRAVVDGLTTNDRVTMYTFGQPRVGCSVFAFKHDELVPNRSVGASGTLKMAHILRSDSDRQ